MREGNQSAQLQHSRAYVTQAIDPAPSKNIAILLIDSYTQPCLAANMNSITIHGIFGERLPDAPFRVSCRQSTRDSAKDTCVPRFDFAF